jgi:hypothetical protein
MAASWESTNLRALGGDGLFRSIVSPIDGVSVIGKFQMVFWSLEAGFISFVL